ncbi:MAG: PEP-CTERM sorting domain-containing protein [Pseudomonadota bacterium]
MSTSRKTILAVLFTIGMVANVAKAAIVTLTISGTVTAGVDLLGQFKTGSPDLTGQAYVQTLSFDTSDLNVIDSTPYRFAAGFDNKLIHASGSSTINGQTFSWQSAIAQAHLALSAQVVHGGGDEFQMGADVWASPAEYLQAGMYLNSSQVSFVDNADPGKAHDFNGDLSGYSPYAYFVNSQGLGQYTYFEGNLSSVSYEVSPVPEASQFAMLLFGLGAAALLGRKKNRQQ